MYITNHKMGHVDIVRNMRRIRDLKIALVKEEHLRDELEYVISSREFDNAPDYVKDAFDAFGRDESLMYAYNRACMMVNALTNEIDMLKNPKYTIKTDNIPCYSYGF